MKKIVTLFVLITAFFAGNAFAQPGSPCSAAFNYSVSASGYQVQFTPLRAASSYGTMDVWNFGDGTGYNSEVLPSATPVVQQHSYTTPGTYAVMHKVVSHDSNWAVTCSDSLVVTVNITATMPCHINAGFSFERDSVYSNVVHFNIDSNTDYQNALIQWNFGDGAVGYGTNPVHAYNGSGLYNVCLVISRDALCRDSVCHLVQVQGATTPVCNAAFTNTITNNQVQFISVNTPGQFYVSHEWSFGDGQIDYNNSTNPLHFYQAPGTYYVTHTVSKYSGNYLVCTDSVGVAITITGGIPCPAAEFVYYADSAQLNSIQFYGIFGNAAGSAAMLWNFGDSTTSTEQNPVHAYASPGIYNVCLHIVRDSACFGDVCRTIQVLAPAQPCSLVAAFTNYTDSSNTRLVHFSNQTAGYAAGDSIRYTFGDGTNSTDVNPSHTYNAAGTYMVCLRVKKYTVPGTQPCVSEICHTVTVVANPPACNLNVNFSWAADSVNSLKIKFTNLTTPYSANTISLWTFGDGSSMTDRTANHVYNQPGQYQVCLKVTQNSTCIRDTCITITVTQTQQPCNVTAAFSLYNDSIMGGNPVQYHFFNNTVSLSGVDSSFWDFGDGTPIIITHDSVLNHLYSAPGTYTVCLRVVRTIPGTTLTCESRVCQTVVVPSVPPVTCNLITNFSTTVDSANSRKIYFSNLTNAQPAQANAHWSFGDGTVSNDWNVIHIYAQAGQYRACLSVSNNLCISDTCMMVTVTATPTDSCNLQVSFTSRADSSNHRKIFFTNTSISNVTQSTAAWSFGDGTSGTGNHPDHVYAQPGRYAVCLTVASGNCSRTQCDSIIVTGNTTPAVNCDSIHLDIVYHADTYIPNKLFFFGNSTVPMLHQRWTFTQLSGTGSTVVVNQNNPDHLFTDTGYYSVCVRGEYANGCIKEYCELIYISSVTATAQCILSAYPNPANNQVSSNLQLEQPGLITATVYNLQGMVLLQTTQNGIAGNNLVTLNIQNLVPGIYTIRFVYGNKICFTRFQKL